MRRSAAAALLLLLLQPFVGAVARASDPPSLAFLPIFARARDEFFYRVVEAGLSFHRDATGRVDRLTLHQNGRDIPAVRDPSPPPHIEFPSAAALTAYAGEYDFGAFQPGATITVAARGDTLVVTLTGQLAVPVYAVGPDRFEYDVVTASLTFERDAAGWVAAVVLHQHGLDMRAPPR